VDGVVRGAAMIPSATTTMIAAAAMALAATAPGTATAAPAPADVFALVVTNNRSTKLDRPDLQYADDDGARYYQMFRGVAPAARVRLLTRFDRSTATEHPELAAAVNPPRRAELDAALAALQADVAAARRAGRRTELYFVFAGHGDVEGGVGYLDLEDGRIDSGFLEREVVERVAADVQHIVLDSCNSFFVVNPRKPGGRRWATPADLALGFARRHPNVGLFLSTNSEAEVYEWSELESGIFSHEVRSGLSGAADANGDGQVTYAELAGFVDRANARLPRANLRPQVFQRGPNGDASTPLFSPALASGRRVVLGSPERRVWIRGAAAERLIDLHKEEGPMTVVVPGPVEQPLSIVEWHAAGLPGARPSLAEYEAPMDGAAVDLGTLAARPADSRARGGSAMFAELFKSPYGAHAFQAFLDQEAHASEPVFGITTADEARMRHYLTFIADSDREISRVQGLYVGGVGLLITGIGIAGATEASHWSGASRPGGVLLGGIGLGILGLGLRLGLAETAGQKALASFEAELHASPENRGAAVAHLESHLGDLARSERRMAHIVGGFMGVASLALAALATVHVVDGSGREPVKIVGTYGAAVLAGVLAWRIAHLEMPTERLLRLYRTDPGLQLQVGAAPLPGGAGFSLSARF
jgi:hypothetical protein